MSAEDWQRATIDEWKLKEEPAGFARTQVVTADGRPLDAYTSRALLVAPICTRTSWFLKDGTRFREYVQGARQHVQAIAFLAILDEKKLPVPLGPAMLTAKGYQGKNILDSFVAWDRATKTVRGKAAPGVPAWCFYLSIGTFKQQRESIMVGKGDQHPITPISCYVPKEITPDLIERLFVGQEIAEQMAAYLDLSQEWLHAYDHKRIAEPGAAPVDGDAYLDPVDNRDTGEAYPYGSTVFDGKTLTK